jgi:uncharacterized repeat protein (TIGR01451 family)
VIATVSLGDGPAGIAMAPSRADLSVTKMDSPDPVSALSSLTYTMIVTNNGPQEATGVTLTDTLPEDLGSTSIAPTQGSCEEAGGTVSCDLGALPAGASATVTIVAAPQSEGVIENTVSVTANEVDADTLNNSATAGTTVDPTSPPLPIPGVTLWGIIAMVGLIAAVLFWRLSGIRAGAGPRGVQG